MIFSFNRIIFVGAISLAFPLLADGIDYDTLRRSIMASFTDSAQSHYQNGKFEWYSENIRVLGDEDNKLDFKTDANTWSSAFTCGVKKCEVTGNVRDEVSLPDFQSSKKQVSYSSYNECRNGIGELNASKDYQKVEVGNCNVYFPSDIKAGAVQVNSDGVIYLNSGNYWFDSFQLNNSAELRVNGAVTIFVKENFHLNSLSKVNIEGETKDLLFVSYGGNNIALDNHARLNGFLYAKGNLALNGHASVVGRVNVKNLTLNNYALIEGVSSGISPGNGSVHHYELHFNSCNALLTAKACGDESCSVLYDEKATIHVQNQGHPPRNIANFNNFLGLAQQDISQAAEHLNYRFTLGYQANGNGGNLWPKPSSGLICYVDGQRTCTVNGKSSSGSGSGFNFAADTRADA